jgi:ATP-dependent RNA helicase DDX19/DBP5
MLRSELVNCQSDLEIMRKDPNSPLYSVKSFEALNLFVSVTVFPFSVSFNILLISRKLELLKGVYGMGFNAPSKIDR